MKQTREGKMKNAVTVGIVVVLLVLLVSSVSATWCNNDYGKKRPIHIGNPGGTEQTDYQVMLNYSHDSDINANFSDIRVYNESDCSLVWLWNESAVSGTWNKIWFKAPYIPSYPFCNDTYALYYNNASASSVSNGTNTWIDFQNFDEQGTGETPTGWTGTGSTSNAQSHSGDISLRLADGDIPYRALTQFSGDNDTKLMFFYRVTGSTPKISFFFGDGNYYDLHLSIGDGIGDLTFYHWTTAWQDTGVSGAGDVWKKMELNNIDFTNDRHDWYYDETIIKEKTPFRVANSYIEKIRIHADAGSEIFFDDLCVGKYTDPEPTACLGDEETCGVGSPNITTWYNNVTCNDTLSFSIPLSPPNTTQNVFFNATANQSVTWHWVIDAIPQDHDYDNIVINWTANGTKYVHVYGTNGNGQTQTITWEVVVGEDLYATMSSIFGIETMLAETLIFLVLLVLDFGLVLFVFRDTHDIFYGDSDVSIATVIVSFLAVTLSFILARRALIYPIEMPELNYFLLAIALVMVVMLARFVIQIVINTFYAMKAKSY